MRIVHLASSPPAKQNRPSKKDLDLASAQRWVDLQEHSNYRKALVDNKKDIESVRLRDKNFVPVKA